MMTMIDVPVLTTLLAAEPGWLMSLWKPILFLAPFVLWARIVTNVFDKHAARFFLPRTQWNLAHLGVGLLALVGALFVGSLLGGEGGFWAAFALVLILLAADLYAYMHVSSKDDRVPERHRIKIGKSDLGDDKDTKKEKKGPTKGKTGETIRTTIKTADAKGKFVVPMANAAVDTPEFSARVAAERVFYEAVESRATQAEIGPGKENQYTIRFLVDGVYQQGASMPPPDAARIMDFWKTAAKLDVADRRKKQTADISIEDATTKKLARITSIGAQGGMRVTMLFDPEKSVQRDPKTLGLLDSQLTELKALADERQGVVLLCSPPDSGRTTLMYSMLRLHDAYTSNVHTVEVESQGAPDGVRVNKWDAQGGLTAGAPAPEFSTLVRSIMRRDPDVVAVGDLVDAATAKEVAKADHQRTRSYLCFKAGDPFTAIQIWQKSVGDTKLSADCLHGVVVGKLVRKLCTNCRATYPPTPDMLKKLGIGEGKVSQLFKKGGQVLIKDKPQVCPVCKGIGYVGTEGVFEVYSITKEERDLIAQGNLQGVKASWRKRGIPSIQQVAIKKAVEGITSVEEITRITAAETGTAAASTPGAAPAATPAV